MKLVLIPPGEFQMGSPEEDNEYPHRVRITKPFYLGVYEVTQAEYERVMGTNPSAFSKNGSKSKYVEEMMLTAGHDKECVEHSHWDEAHERHAFRILRHYRQGLYQKILERLPFAEVTRPDIDWDERRRTVLGILAGEG